MTAHLFWRNNNDMHAPPEIAHVWERFSSFSTETFTKAWWYQKCDGSVQQRSVGLMREHRGEYGASGNCFDLAIWLQEEFAVAGIETLTIGRGLFTSKAHIAVVAFDQNGRRYLCDLGDQWLQPILIDKPGDGFSPEYHSGFCPGVRVRVETAGEQLVLSFLRPNEKDTVEQFSLASIPADVLMRASGYSQALLRRPFASVRAFYEESGTTEMWDYDREECCWHLEAGKRPESDCVDRACWTDRIHQMTGISTDIISTAFDVYAQQGIEM